MTIKELYKLAQAIAVRRWPPVSPWRPNVDFTIGYLPDGSPVTWPSGQLDSPDMWLCITCGASVVDLEDIDSGCTVGAEWDRVGIERAIQFARSTVEDIEKSWRARLQSNLAKELEEQSDALIVSGLVAPDWRPGFRLLAPAVWSLSRLGGPWSGEDVRRAVFAALSQEETPIKSVTVLYDHRPFDVRFGLTDELQLRIHGFWNRSWLSTCLLLGESFDSLVYDFSNDLLYNAVAETCKCPCEVIRLVDAASALFRLLSGGTE